MVGRARRARRFRIDDIERGGKGDFSFRLFASIGGSVERDYGILVERLVENIVEPRLAFCRADNFWTHCHPCGVCGGL